MVIKRASAPIRIDFAGGTTDIKPFTHTHGGAVLNATINHYVYGKLIARNDSTKLEYHADIPTSSGLGTSSAMNVVWTALITRLKDKKEIAENVFRIEQATSSSRVNGKQDMYASAFGGINFMEFKKDNVIIEKLNLETYERSKLSRQTVSPQLKEIIELGNKKGALAAKVCGSGGGGSVLFYTENRRRLEKVFGKKVIQFKFDWEGLRWG